MRRALIRQVVVGVAYLAGCGLLPFVWRPSLWSRLDGADLAALLGLQAAGYVVATVVVGLPVLGRWWKTRGWPVAVVLLTLAATASAGLAYGVGTGHSVAHSVEWVGLASWLGLPLAGLLLWVHASGRGALTLGAQGDTRR